MSKTPNPDALSTGSKGPEMAPPPVQFHTMPGGERIAFRYHPSAHGEGGAEGAGPLLVFLPGYMSDMDGGKARAIMAEAQAHGHPCLLLDYSGCGRSDGAFADGTLSRWRDEVLALIAARQAEKIIDPNINSQFDTGRLLACISSRPGQCGRCDGYILEGKELEFYVKKMARKKK